MRNRFLTTQPRTPSLMLDSGAFSAWLRGETIDCAAYAEFAMRNEDKFDFIVNVDVIPGVAFNKALHRQAIKEGAFEKSVEKGWENYEFLLAQGVPKDKLIHVFHQGESLKVLNEMVARMDYIGLSPANDKSTAEKMRWLDHCMERVCDDEGYPVVKFHGFAVTSWQIMEHYPWFSVDSTSWVLTSRYGAVFAPPYTSINRYDQPPVKVNISAVGSNNEKREKDGDHFELLDPVRKAALMVYFEELGVPLGKSRFEGDMEHILEHGLRNSHQLRDRVNLNYQIRWWGHLPKWPWPYRQTGKRVDAKVPRSFFAPPRPTKALNVDKAELAGIRFATWMEANQGLSLNCFLGANKRLLSYYHLREHKDPDAWLDQYARLGHVANMEDDYNGKTTRRRRKSLRANQGGA